MFFPSSRLPQIRIPVYTWYRHQIALGAHLDITAGSMSILGTDFPNSTWCTFGCILQSKEVTTKALGMNSSSEAHPQHTAPGPCAPKLLSSGKPLVFHLGLVLVFCGPPRQPPLSGPPMPGHRQLGHLLLLFLLHLVKLTVSCQTQGTFGSTKELGCQRLDKLSVLGRCPFV